MEFWKEHVDGFKSQEYVPSVLEPIVGTIFYATMVYSLKKWMKERESKEKLDLKNVAIVHNLILIILSVVMGLGSAHEIFTRATTLGFDGLFCSGTVLKQGTTTDGAAGFWIKIYYLSKYYELGDTFLLCLKGSATIPLHLYHHGLMMWATWAWCSYDIYEGTIWCVFVNSIIHTAMYIYYLCAVLGIRVWWKKYLTVAQIIQFGTGFVYVSIFLYLHFTRQYGCGENDRAYVMLAQHVGNTSFIVLFSMFYKKSYTQKKRPASEVAQELIDEEKFEADAKAAPEKHQPHFSKKQTMRKRK